MQRLALLIVLLLPFSAFAEGRLQHNQHILRQELEKYSDIAEAGGWEQISNGKIIKPDDEDPRVAELYTRLLQEKFIKDSQSSPSSIYAGPIVSAVQNFQYTHNLAADGVVGPATLKALNIPASARARQIQINIERLQALPETLGRRYILVNIAGFHLKAEGDGQDALKMRVIVGQSEHPTPIFNSSISEVIFHPYWYAPDRLSYEHVLPQIQKNPELIQKNGYELFKREDGRLVKVNLDTINLNTLTRKDFDHYLFRQKPGFNNAMGVLKFPLDHSLDIYLHDTPGKTLFNHNIRNLSNGCVRLEDPLALAKFALHGEDDWPDDRIDALYNASITPETTSIHVKLVEPLPVYIVYLTADVDDSERLRFYDDVYGLDKSQSLPEQ